MNLLLTHCQSDYYQCHNYNTMCSGGTSTDDLEIGAEMDGETAKVFY